MKGRNEKEKWCFIEEFDSLCTSAIRRTISNSHSTEHKRQRVSPNHKIIKSCKKDGSSMFWKKKN